MVAGAPRARHGAGERGGVHGRWVTHGRRLRRRMSGVVQGGVHGRVPPHRVVHGGRVRTVVRVGRMGETTTPVVMMIRHHCVLLLMHKMGNMLRNVGVYHGVVVRNMLLMVPVVVHQRGVC